MTASRFSTAPFGLPGRFTMSADRRVPACALESVAIRVLLRDTALITSPNPSSLFSRSGVTASGVTSRRPIPVPPVVTTSRIPSPSMAVRTQSAMASISSGTTSIRSTWKPCRSRRSRTAGPEASIRFPDETLSLQVMTRANVMEQIVMVPAPAVLILAGP